MKTTLDLPEDIAHVLRLESARRGGRKAASVTSLVADAVRKTYGAPAGKKPRIDLTPGRVVISAAADAPKLTPALIRGALYTGHKLATHDAGLLAQWPEHTLRVA